MNSISSLPLEELQAAIKSKGQPAFRAGQIFDWLHNKQAASFDEMANLPKPLRESLAGDYKIDTLMPLREQHSKDGTVKYLFGLEDGAAIETVLMRYKHGNTLCISSQVGCRMGCNFCASTQCGLERSLTAGEMAAEVYLAMATSGERVSNIVLMGIGEPLDNFEAVIDFIRIITHPQGLNLSGRGISLSTCGLVPMIDRLADLRLPITLSVSLHAADNVKRSGMMPINDAYPLEKLIPSCKRYFERTGRRISFEYAMVRGVNDTPQDVQNLTQLLKGLNTHINLIPINPVNGSPYGPSDEENIKGFAAMLQKKGLNATVRRRLGTDIDAACGQLRQKSKQPS